MSIICNLILVQPNPIQIHISSHSPSLPESQTSMEPFNLDSPGFVNLLSSQGSQSFNFDSSEVPASCTQSPEDPKTVLRKHWSPKDDVVLISAWLNTSKDPIISNEQKGINFRKRNVHYYNSSPHVTLSKKREWTHCKQRWGRLNDPVCKFAGAYEAALKCQASGESDVDLMKTAHDIYFNDYGSKFTLEHAWRELRNDPKWCSTMKTRETEKEKRKEPDPVQVEEVASASRPPGVKASKAAKRKKGSADTNIEKLESIQKQKILETLLAKSNPLSEIEEELKTKLITEMLGHG